MEHGRENNVLCRVYTGSAKCKRDIYLSNDYINDWKTYLNFKGLGDFISRVEQIQ